jgi:hypothetical protein
MLGIARSGVASKAPGLSGKGAKRTNSGQGWQGPPQDSPGHSVPSTMSAFGALNDFDAADRSGVGVAVVEAVGVEGAPSTAHGVILHSIHGTESTGVMS